MRQRHEPILESPLFGSTCPGTVQGTAALFRIRSPLEHLPSDVADALHYE